VLLLYSEAVLSSLFTGSEETARRHDSTQASRIPALQVRRQKRRDEMPPDADTEEAEECTAKRSNSTSSSNSSSGNSSSTAHK
jgi:hypothetical protein